MKSGQRLERSAYVELVLEFESSYGKVIAAGKKALGVAEEETFVITTPGGAVIPGASDPNWTIGDYKARKRPTGVLFLALCKQVVSFHFIY